MLVIDASALAVALIDSEDAGAAIRRRMRGERIAAPEIIDLEVASVWRRLTRTGDLSAARAERGLRDLASLSLTRVGHRPLLRRCWQLREHLSVYDAAYVTLAEALDAPLITCDRRLAAAPGVGCPVEVWPPDRG